MSKIYYKKGKKLLFDRIKSIQERLPRVRRKRITRIVPDDPEVLMMNLLDYAILNRPNLDFESLFQKEMALLPISVFGRVQPETFIWEELTHSELALLIKRYYRSLNSDKSLSWYLYQTLRRYEK